jgi:vacuolar-type H+-ATPase subunit I/STV1
MIHGGSHSRVMNSVHESPRTHSRRVDSFEVSESAPDPFQERLNEIEKQRRILEQTIERVRDVREMYRLLAEGIKEQLDKQKKALEVARRIALGDNVPPHEKAYLVENSPVLYREATETRMRRDNEELRIYRRDYSPNE